jgi:hypothetical protein
MKRSLSWRLGLAVVLLILCGDTRAVVIMSNYQCMQTPPTGGTFDSCSAFVKPCGNVACCIVQGFPAGCYLCLPANGYNCRQSSSYLIWATDGGCMPTSGYNTCWCDISGEQSYHTTAPGCD